MKSRILLAAIFIFILSCSERKVIEIADISQDNTFLLDSDSEIRGLSIHIEQNIGSSFDLRLSQSGFNDSNWKLYNVHYDMQKVKIGPMEWYGRQATIEVLQNKEDDPQKGEGK